MRLAKYLARTGVSSRRKCEEIIKEGRVRVNGKTVLLPQEQVSGAEEITLDGSRISGPEKKNYYLLDKPRGYISTVKDTHGRPTVMDLLKHIPVRVYPVGRLDADTSGVLLFTNDGELAARLTHPRYRIEKEYRVCVKGIPKEETLSKLASGVKLEGGATAAAKVKLFKTLKNKDKESAFLKIILQEGRKRQVRLMCSAVGHPVISLRRIRFAFLTARGMRPGEHRKLTTSEIKGLYRITGL